MVLANTFSYPTFTTEHTAWGTVDDVSNRSMSDLYRTLGFAGPDLRTCDLLHIGIVPRCIVRTKIPNPTKIAMNAGVIFGKLPEELLNYWSDMSVAAIQRSNA
jgi:hypothetical protein